MRKFNLSVGVFWTALLLLSTAMVVQAQNDRPRPSLAASVSQRIGVDTDITIAYSRPGVKGRTVWGELVPYGMAPGNQYSNNKPYPWRAGANENTTFTVSNDVLIEGQRLEGGVYSIHMIPAEDGPWTVIFNTVTDAWGSYTYDEGKDALRIQVTPQDAPHAEFLSYGFEDLKGNQATAYLHWEELKIPFTIESAPAN